eukprot:jgi/Tetstr1/461845/TSEL_006924.t1
MNTSLHTRHSLGSICLPGNDDGSKGGKGLDEASAGVSTFSPTRVAELEASRSPPDVPPTAPRYRLADYLVMAAAKAAVTQRFVGGTLTDDEPAPRLVRCQPRRPNVHPARGPKNPKPKPGKPKLATLDE